MKFWEVRQVDNKYHVIEKRYVNEPEYILAICFGPIPANEIVTSMKLHQHIKNDMDSISSSLTSLKNTFEDLNDEFKT